MQPSTLVATWSPKWRHSSSLHRCQDEPTAIYGHEDRGLPVLVYVYRTDREDAVRIRCVNTLASAEPEGVYSAIEARHFCRKLLEHGFRNLKGKQDGKD